MERQATVGPGVLQAEAMRILIVEDEEEVREAACAVMQAAGGVVEAAASAAEAMVIATAQTVPFRLIIVDLRLPELEGPELVKRLRKTVHQRTPIVVMSGTLDARLQEACLRNGANSCVLKPVSADAYMAAVRDVYDYWMHVHRPLLA